jgi:hypothetical protein
MTIDDQIIRAKELTAKREEIDRQIADLFGGTVVTRKPPRCTVCGESGHNAKGCAAKAPPTAAPDNPAI